MDYSQEEQLMAVDRWEKQREWNFCRQELQVTIDMSLA
jgi:hypothetical protein